jgi:prophage regulatory protein
MSIFVARSFGYVVPVAYRSESIMPETYVSDIQIAALYGVHRMTIWRWNKSDPTFPKPFRLSGRCTRWKKSEIDAWESKQRFA